MGQIKIDISQEVIQFLNKNGVYRTNTSNYDIKHHFKDGVLTLKLYTKPSFIKRLIGEKVKYIDTIQFNISELQEIRRKQEGEKCKKDPYDIPGLVVEKPKPKKRRKRTPAQRLQAMRRKEEKEKYKSQK